jgi:hypothetical protein
MTVTILYIFCVGAVINATIYVLFLSMAMKQRMEMEAKQDILERQMEWRSSQAVAKAGEIQQSPAPAPGNPFAKNRVGRPRREIDDFEIKIGGAK